MWNGILFDETFFTKACSDTTRDNVFKLKEGRFKLDIGGEKKRKKNFLHAEYGEAGELELDDL